MAKSSKVEDYWRQNNVENLLKELTQLLARRMPPDPAIAIVEHLQKKFPKSFKTSANNLQMQSITSPHSDLQNENLNDVQLERRSSNLSQTSSMVTIPTVGSAFTNLLKQETSSSRLAPETMIKSLVFANRLGQQVVKMRKDIRSDHDILEEEVIKPIKRNSKAAATANVSINSASEDLDNAEINEEPSVPQLIKYKQQIHMEHDRRIHQEELAALAKHQRQKEEFIRSDLSAKPEEIQQQQMEEDDGISSQIVPIETKTDAKLSHKSSIKSKEEEEILNDENVFQPRKQRNRVRPRNKLSTPHPPNMPYIRGGSIADFRSIMRKGDENIICKVCGNIANGEENNQHNPAAPTALSSLPLSQSVETTNGTVDDWFAPTSESSSQKPDDLISPPIGSTTFRRNLFQPNNDIVEHRSTTPRITESGVFARSSEPKVRRSSSTRSTPSPKKHQTEPHQLANTLPPQPSSTNARRMSGWSVRERSPDDSDEN